MQFKFWKPNKGHNSKSYGPLATILWFLHPTYLRDHVYSISFIEVGPQTSCSMAEGPIRNLVQTV